MPSVRNCQSSHNKPHKRRHIAPDTLLSLFNRETNYKERAKSWKWEHSHLKLASSCPFGLFRRSRLRVGENLRRPRRTVPPRRGYLKSHQRDEPQERAADTRELFRRPGKQSSEENEKADGLPHVLYGIALAVDCNCIQW